MICHNESSVFSLLQWGFAARLADGKLARRTWARGISTDYSYDAWGSLTNTVYSDGTPTIALVYNALGRQTEAQDAAGITTFLYDSFGSLTNEIVSSVAGTNGIDRVRLDCHSSGSL